MKEAASGHRKILIAGLLLCMWTLLRAQEFSLKTFSFADGLPADYVFQVYQDPTGYLWIGTEHGLSRFDGRIFTNYGYPEGLPDTRVDRFLQDSKHRFWIGTRRGIAELRGNQCISYPVSDSLEITFVFGFVETSDHEILAQTNAGIYGLTNNRWVKRSFYPGYDDHVCREIIVTDEGMYINYGDIIVFRNTEGTYTPVSSLQKVQYHYMSMILVNKQLYVSTLEGIRRLNRSQLEPVPGPAGKKAGLFSFLIDRKGRCWLGSENEGLQVCNLDAQSVLRTIYKAPQANPISQIFEDGDGNIWVSEAQGLIRVNEKPFKIYPVPVAQGGSIRGMFRNASDQSLILNDGSTRILEYHGEQFVSKLLQWQQGIKQSTREFLISNTALDDRGVTWAQLSSLSLVSLMGNTIYPQEASYAHMGNEVFDVLFDLHRKSIVVSMYTQDLPCIKSGDAHFSKMRTTGLQSIPGRINTLHQCRNNTLLLSTTNGVIYSIDTNDYCRMQLDAFQGKGLTAHFYDDVHTGVWVVYPDHGLRRYVWDYDSLSLIETITRRNGLGSETVYDLCFDNNGQLWVLTRKELAIFGYDTARSQYQKVQALSTSDLNLQVFGMHRMSAGDSGKVWIADKAEVLCFDPELLHRMEPVVPAIQIEAVLVNYGQESLAEYADALEGVFQLPKNLNLPHHANTIDIQYAGISMSGTEGVLFSYKLTPVGNTWSPPVSGNSVSFAKLPPGQYTFSVRAQRTESNWSPPATMSFSIRKPFWETWWFMTASVIAMVIFLTTAFQYRLKSIRRKAELREQMQNLEAKALSAQMNPHFIHNALNSIQSLIINGQSQMASQYVNKFAKLLRHVLESADKHLIPLEQELTALRLYIDLERLRMQMDFTFAEEVSEEINTRYVSIPPLLLQPFIENALWHGLSRKEGERILKLSITEDRDWILCRITDNGIGREAAGAASGTFPMGSLSKAINITRARLIAFNKEPDSEPLLTTDLYENHQPSGTEVTVRIRKHVSLG